MRKFLTSVPDDKGVTAILVAVMMVMILGFAALAIDIGYGYLTKNQLQDTADAAALAASRWLGHNYEGKTYEWQQSYDATGDAATIIAVAQDVATKSTVADQDSESANKFSIKSGEVMIGRWDPTQTPDHFSPTMSKPDAVRVIARRDGSANGPITTFFAKIFGIDNMNVSAIATAALTGQSEAGPGGLPLPVAISCWWQDHCGDVIKFYPTGESCAGWNTYTTKPANASQLRKILDAGNPNLLNCATSGASDPSCYQSPKTIAGSTMFEFINGTVAADFSDMEALFDAMKVLNDGVLDKDTDSATWTTSVPVYMNPDGTCDCTPPNQTQLIVGFATIVMSEVVGPSSKELHGQLICGNVEPGRGGGSHYGTLGSISGLVQ